MWFKFLTLVHICAAFPLKCPEPAQWALRANGHCSDPSKYFCLQNDLINGYSENCTRSDFQQPGRKSVLRGGIDAEICSVERYQPFPIKFYSNATTNCIFLKSFCNAEGQLVYDYGNRNTDRTCRCDYRRGYTFLIKPNNPCFCKPAVEDCSCYFSTCSNTSHVLSPDYLCIKNTDIKAVTQCRTITYKNGNYSKTTEPAGHPAEAYYNPFLVLWKKRYPIVGLSVFGCTIVVILALSIRQLWGYHFIAMFTAEPNKTNFVEGEKLQLTFSVYPKDTSVVWYKRNEDNHDIELKDNISNEGNHIMTIENAELKHSGKYAIVAGKVRKDFTVTVQAIPNVIKELNKEDRMKYIDLMKSSEKEERHFVRIMIVGKEGVGKTCLLRRLLDESIDDVQSTDGIDIAVRRCKINILDGKWTIGKDIADNREHRLQNVLVEKESRAKKGKIQNESMEELTKNQDESMGKATKIDNEGMEKEPIIQYESLNNDASKMTVSEMSRPVHEQIKSEEHNNESSMEVQVRNRTTTIPSKLKTSKPMARKRNEDTTDEGNISLHKTSTDTKAINYTIEPRNFNNKDNKMDRYEKGNKHISITDTETTFKEDVSEFEMPEDLMSQILPSSSTSTIPPERYALCGLWDFAGQKDFYATHQVFLSRRAIYLVVADMETDVCKEKEKKEDTKEQADATQNVMNTITADGEYVDYWFDSIHCYQTPKRSGDDPYEPPVIVVFTGADKYLDKELLDKRKEELEKQLITVIGKQTKYKHLRNSFYLSNCIKSDEDHVKLRETISQIAKNMQNWGESVPIKWILLEHLIEINKKKGKNFITFDDMVNLAKHKDVSISDPEDLNLFLHVQSQEGNIIYFEEIKNLIILEPRWLVDAFRSLVSNKLEVNNMSDLPDSSKICFDSEVLRSTGKISDLLIKTLFQQKTTRGNLFLGQKDDLIEVMKKFDILVDIKGSDAYLMPSMVPSCELKTVCEKIGIVQENCERTSWFCLTFKFLPPVFFNHLSAWLIKTYIPSKMEDGSNALALYREVCVFDFEENGSVKLLITMSSNTIAVQVVSFDQNKKNFSFYCISVCKTLVEKVEDIKKRYNLNLSYSKGYKCGDGQFDINIRSLEDLQKHKDYLCPLHQKLHESKSMYSPWKENSIPDKCGYCEQIPVKRCFECRNVLCDDCYLTHNVLMKEGDHTFQSSNEKLQLKEILKLDNDMVDMKALPGGLLVIGLRYSDKLLTYLESGEQRTISVGKGICSVAILNPNTVVILLSHAFQRVESMKTVDIIKRTVIEHEDMKFSHPYDRFCRMVYIDNHLYVSSLSGITVMHMSGTKNKQINLGFRPTDVCYETKKGRIYCIDDSEKKLICIDRDGNIIFTSSGLKDAKRLTIHTEGSVLILCHQNYDAKEFKVHRISQDGESAELICTVKLHNVYRLDVFGCSSISFQESSDSVIIGINNKVYIFKQN